MCLFYATFAPMNQNKRLTTLLLTLLLLITGGTSCRAQASLTAEEKARIDTTISVSFITCGPGREAYSLYGHTALHYIDRLNGTDVAVNWGVFSFAKPNFVARFVFGLTDYEIGIIPFHLFLQEYRETNRWVIEQQLDLTAEEKVSIAEAISNNYLPENREYRYNYFYDNCTTRARDMIIGHLNSEVNYKESEQGGPTFRELVHEQCKNSPWSRFGNDMLLGVGADKTTTIAERQFLPVITMSDFTTATLSDGRKLVKNTATLLTADEQEVAEDVWFTPLNSALLLLIVTVALTVLEITRKKDFRLFDALLMTLCGLPGIVLTLMLFSQHPTVRCNLQLLLLNPLPLFFILPMLKERCHWQYKMWIILICLFFIGAIWQTYAEGMLMVASSLLIRNIRRLRSEK